MPAEYSRDNPTLYRAPLERNLGGIPDEGTIEDEATNTVLRMAVRADPNIVPAKIDLSKTYDNRFARNAAQKYK